MFLCLFCVPSDPVFPQLLNVSGLEEHIVLPDVLFGSLGDASSVLPPLVFFSQEGPVELLMCNGLFHLLKLFPFPLYHM